MGGIRRLLRHLTGPTRNRPAVIAPSTSFLISDEVIPFEYEDLDEQTGKTLILLTAKEPMLEWLRMRKAREKIQTGMDIADPFEMARTPTVVHVDLNYSEVDDFIEQFGGDLLAHVLGGWYRDVRTWPPTVDTATLRAWFTIELEELLDGDVSAWNFEWRRLHNQAHGIH